MKPHLKPIPSESQLFKVELQQTNKEFDYPWHYHPELEITYIINSQGVRYVGNSSENFFSDELVLIGANVPHTWQCIPERKEAASAIVIYLKEHFMEKSWMQSIEFLSIRNLLGNMGRGILVDSDVALTLKPKFYKLLELPEFEKIILLLEILQDLAKNTSYRYLCEHAFTGTLNHTDKTRINTIFDYVQTNYLKQISLADVSSKVNMSEEYFSRFFSKTMKKPFFEFLNEYKINMACKLLIETDKQISEICYASGFESIPFFYRQFKKFKKCQPKAFRSNYQNVSAFN